MHTKVKICGIQSTSDIEILNEVLPDMAGFIFVPGRRRYIQPEVAEEIRRCLDPRIKTVGVFVDASPEEIQRVRDICPTDMIQLHGQESLDMVQKVRERYQVPVIKAYDVGKLLGRKQERGGLMAAHPWDLVRNPLAQAAADYILLDNGPGGTGATFDWNRIQELGNVNRPFILAGGLGIGNIVEAIEKVHPYGVDVSSGLESQGKKDPEKIREFMAILRGLEAEETM